MATHIAVLVGFSDGSFTFLRDDVTAETLTEIQTDASGILNLTANVSVGVANQGKVATQAMAKVQTDGATTGSLMYCAFYDAQGSVLCPIQGGGANCTKLPNVIKPVRMQSGVVVKAEWQVQSAAIQHASLAVYTAGGKCDIFSVLAVDGVATEMKNAQGAGWGESLAGQTVIGAYATYSATNGLADTGVADGIDAFYVESSSGQLLGMFPPEKGQGHVPTPWIYQTIRVNQNDVLTVTANI